MVRPPIIKVVRDLELEENLDLSCEARKHLDDLFGDRMNLSALIDNPIPNWFDSSSYFVIPSDNFKQGIRIYNQGFNLEALREKKKKVFCWRFNLSIWRFISRWKL